MIYHIASGQAVIIDDVDLNKIQKHRYYLIKKSGIIIRAIYSKEKKQTISQVGLAHDILRGKSSRPIIHINGDKRDFRRENLKFVKPGRKNIQSGLSYANTSGYRGVSKYKNSGKWVACIRVNYKKKNLGTFLDPKDAATAYNNAAEKYFGPEFKGYNKV